MMHSDAAVIAEQAWDASKAEDDAPYKACQIDHQLKLASLVSTIDDHKDDPDHTIGVQGLEAFEQEVLKILHAEEAVAVAALLPPATDDTDNSSAIDAEEVN